MNTKNTYHLFEGIITTEKPVQDRSVNIMMFRDPQNSEYNIIINRTTLEEEQTLEDFCEMQIEKLRNDLPGFQVDGKRLKHQIGPEKLPVIQVANRFLQNGKMVKQVQSVVQLPSPVINNNFLDVIIFTLHTESDFTDYQRKHYVRLINSFRSTLFINK